jgi:hypothetical protein
MYYACNLITTRLILQLSYFSYIFKFNNLITYAVKCFFFLHLPLFENEMRERVKINLSPGITPLSHFYPIFKWAFLYFNNIQMKRMVIFNNIEKLYFEKLSCLLITFVSPASAKKKSEKRISHF